MNRRGYLTPYRQAGRLLRFTAENINYLEDLGYRQSSDRQPNIGPVIATNRDSDLSFRVDENRSEREH